jgi:hypothetical protein
MGISLKGATFEPGVTERSGDAQELSAKKGAFRSGEGRGRCLVEQDS